ncbi:putative FACT complex subunit ssrp1-B [Monocercomonoides exilis]|uniref:putative FACT complex subunit ssrp1-B n=1 Tax=Monocercomonoides exilis TaxID=2049356 RepID=UPI003559A6D3|nr:putative FACT complex subunit ssrp1-B [Monocercomonoides exilis]
MQTTLKDQKGIKKLVNMWKINNIFSEFIEELISLVEMDVDDQVQEVQEVLEAKPFIKKLRPTSPTPIKEEAPKEVSPTPPTIDLPPPQTSTESSSFDIPDDMDMMALLELAKKKEQMNKSSELDKYTPKVSSFADSAVSAPSYIPPYRPLSPVTSQSPSHRSTSMNSTSSFYSSNASTDSSQLLSQDPLPTQPAPSEPQPLSEADVLLIVQTLPSLPLEEQNTVVQRLIEMLKIFPQYATVIEQAILGFASTGTQMGTSAVESTRQPSDRYLSGIPPSSNFSADSTDVYSSYAGAAAQGPKANSVSADENASYLASSDAYAATSAQRTTYSPYAQPFSEAQSYQDLSYGPSMGSGFHNEMGYRASSAKGLEKHRYQEMDYEGNISHSQERDRRPMKRAFHDDISNSRQNWHQNKESERGRGRDRERAYDREKDEGRERRRGTSAPYRDSGKSREKNHSSDKDRDYSHKHDSPRKGRAYKSGWDAPAMPAMPAMQQSAPNMPQQAKPDFSGRGEDTDDIWGDNLLKRGEFSTSATEGFSWRATPADAPTLLNPSDIATVSFMQTITGNSLRFKLKIGGDLSFFGFRSQDYTQLKDAVKSLCPNKELRIMKANISGSNWGDLDIDENFTFTCDKAVTFEFPTSYISQVDRNTQTKILEIRLDNDPAVQSGLDAVSELKFYVPETETSEQDVESLRVQITDKAKLSSTTGEVIIKLPQVAVLVPRGRYEIEMYRSLLSMHGATHNYKIEYSNINELYLLHNKGTKTANFVLSLNRPLVQGHTLYKHVVMELNTENTVEVEAHLTDEELKAYDGFIDHNMEGSQMNVVVKVFRALTGQRIASARNFMNHEGHAGLKCSHGPQSGMLFILDKTLVYIYKPTLIIKINRIARIEFPRNDRSGPSSSSRTFDMTVHLRDGDILEFTNFAQDDFEPLKKFLAEKNPNMFSKADLKSKGEEEEQGKHLQVENDEDDEDEDEEEKNEKNEKKEKTDAEGDEDKLKPRPKIMDDDDE